MNEPLGAAFAGYPAIVVQVDDSRGRRPPRGATLGALLRHLVETADQPFEMTRNQLFMLAPEVVDAVVRAANLLVRQ